MPLIVGKDTYVTLQEIKDISVDTDVTSKSDADLEILAKKSFYLLDGLFPEFKLKGVRVSDTQTANFPRTDISNNEIPQDVKIAQIFLMSEYKSGTTTSISPIKRIKVGDIEQEFAVASGVAVTDSTNMTIVKNYMRKYMVMKIC